MMAEVLALKGSFERADERLDDVENQVSGLDTRVEKLSAWRNGIGGVFAGLDLW